MKQCETQRLLEQINLLTSFLLSSNLVVSFCRWSQSEVDLQQKVCPGRRMEAAAGWKHFIQQSWKWCWLKIQSLIWLFFKSSFQQLLLHTLKAAAALQDASLSRTGPRNCSMLNHCLQLCGPWGLQSRHTWLYEGLQGKVESNYHNHNMRC